MTITKKTKKLKTQRERKGKTNATTEEKRWPCCHTLIGCCTHPQLFPALPFRRQTSIMKKEGDKEEREDQIVNTTIAIRSTFRHILPDRCGMICAILQIRFQCDLKSVSRARFIRNPLKREKKGC